MIRILFITIASITCWFSKPAQAQKVSPGLELLDQNKFSEARSYFEKNLESDPSAYYYVMVSYYNNGQENEATQWAAKALDSKPNEPYTYIAQGLLDISDKDKNKAKTNFEKALELAGKNSSNIKVEISQVIADNVFLPLNEYALGLIESALETDKKNKRWYITYGDVLRINEQSGKGKEQYTQALKLDKNYTLAYNRLGELWLKVDNKESSLENLNAALKSNPNFTLTYRNFGEYYYKEGKVKEAIENYKKYISMVGNSINERLKYAGVLYANKLYDEAIVELENVAKIDPKNEYLLQLMSLTYYDAVQNEKALDATIQYMSIAKPERLTFADYERLGNLYLNLKQDSLALINFEKTIKLADPSYTSPLESISNIYVNKKDFEKAAFYIEKKITEDGKANNINNQNFYTLGSYLYRARNFKKADSVFVIVTNVFPDYPVGYYYRGLINSIIDKEYKTDIAYNIYKTFIEKSANETESYKYQLGEAYYYLSAYEANKKRYKDAKEHVSKSLEFYDDSRAKSLKDYLSQF